MCGITLVSLTSKWCYSLGMQTEQTFTIEEVTPAIASDWLERFNTDNFRPVSARRVDALALEMSLGRWEMNGDPVRFRSPDGVLIDGQHRLSAIVKSGVTCRMLVVRGLSDSVTATIDTGSRRNAGHLAGHLGFKHANGAAAGASIVLRYYADAYNNGTHTNHEFRAPVFVQDELLRRRDEYQADVLLAREAWQSQKRFTPSSTVAFLAIMSDADRRQEAIDFVRSVADMEFEPNSHEWSFSRWLARQEPGQQRWSAVLLSALITTANRMGQSEPPAAHIKPWRSSAGRSKFPRLLDALGA